MKLQALVCVLFALASAPSFAVVTKNCPQQLSVKFDQPQIERWYAEEAYQNYFAENSVKGDFYLKGTYGSECTYYEVEGGQSPIYQIVIRGTFQGGKNPTLVTYMSLPIRGQISHDVGNAIAYTDLVELKPEGVKFKGETSLYYASEQCSYGDCIPDYIYLGSFEEVEIR